MADSVIKAETTTVVKDDPKSDPTSGLLIKQEVKVEKQDIKPPHASNFRVKRNNKATRFARKFTRAQEETPKNTPKYVNDIFQRMNISNNVALDDGPSITIDVQPDYRNIFLTLNYHVTKIFQDLSIEDNPLLTPSSLMAYLLSMIYGHALIGETSAIRNVRSQYANEFTSSDQRRNLLTIIENSPIPPFLQDILEGLMPTTDPRREGMQYVQCTHMCSLSIQTRFWKSISNDNVSKSTYFMCFTSSKCTRRGYIKFLA